MKKFIPPSIQSTIPMNTPKTIQIPSSLVDSSLVSYAVILILHGLKSFLYLRGWLFMTLVIFGLILNMFGSVLNTYGSDLMPIHHSNFYTYQFSRVAHSFPNLSLYPHGVTESFVFVVQYAIFLIYNIFFILISDMVRCYIILEERNVITSQFCSYTKN